MNCGYLCVVKIDWLADLPSQMLSTDELSQCVKISVAPSSGQREETFFVQVVNTALIEGSNAAWVAKTALEAFFRMVLCSWGGYPDRKDNDVVADIELSIYKSFDKSFVQRWSSCWHQMLPRRSLDTERICFLQPCFVNNYTEWRKRL